jgi:hypothetical protein
MVVVVVVVMVVGVVVMSVVVFRMHDHFSGFIMMRMVGSGMDPATTQRNRAVREQQDRN